MIALLALAALQGPVDVGDRLELFVDHHLIERLDGVELRLHEPRSADVSLRLDEPWEGIVSGYFTVIDDAGRTDGPRYRMYYRGRPTTSRADGTEEAREVTCYAESEDGVRWVRPELGLFEVAGTRANNVILVEPRAATHDFCPFLDTRPGVPADERYKAVGGLSTTGLLGFASADGIHWRQLGDEPLIREGAFDSQNVAFWSSHEGRYLCYFRTWKGGWRWISRASSPDFRTWSEPVDMGFGDAPPEHLYTNQTAPYFRAPHVYVGTAARFWPGRRALTEEQIASIGLREPDRYAGLESGVSDAVLLTSRGGDRYERTFLESFVRPGGDPRDWVARSNYPALGVLPTGPREMSIWVQRHYGQPTAHLERLTLRTDGFASARAGARGGELLTRPLRFGPIADRDDSAEPIDDGTWPRFDRPAVHALPGTRALGDRVTLIARVSEVPAGHRRLFSAYDGGDTRPGELVLDLDSDGDLGDGAGLRFLYDDVRVTVATTDWSASEASHHVAATWSDGVVSLFLDGVEVVRGGQKGGGPIELALGDLRFGEDYPPTSLSNEPFLGRVEELAVLRRALAPAEVAAHAREPGPGPVRDGDHYWSAEGGAGPPRIGRSGGARRALVLNYATSAAGGLRVEVQDADGAPIPGFRLEDCDERIGDEIEGVVTWRGRAELSSLEGRAVRLRFALRDADLYSFRFR